jgi:hypothetical protein
MKMIIYCDSCGVLLPNADKRGERCTCCQATGRIATRRTSRTICFSRRPSAARILAEIRESVRQ